MTPPISWFDLTDLAVLAHEASGQLLVCDGRELAFQLQEGTLEDQIDQLISWLQQNANGLKGIFVTDSDGLPIGNYQTPQDYIAISAAFAATMKQASRDLQKDTHRIAINISADETMHLIAVDTSVGWLVVGLIATEQLAEDWLNIASQGLSKITQMHGENRG